MNQTDKYSEIWERAILILAETHPNVSAVYGAATVEIDLLHGYCLTYNENDAVSRFNADTAKRRHVEMTMLRALKDAAIELFGREGAEGFGLAIHVGPIPDPKRIASELRKATEALPAATKPIVEPAIGPPASLESFSFGQRAEVDAYRRVKHFGDIIRARVRSHPIEWVEGVDFVQVNPETITQRFADVLESLATNDEHDIDTAIAAAIADLIRLRRGEL